MVLETSSKQDFIDISYYAKDGRLTLPSDAHEKRYRWRDMINESLRLGRPLNEEEYESFRI